MRSACRGKADQTARAAKAEVRFDVCPDALLLQQMGQAPEILPGLATRCGVEVWRENEKGREAADHGM